jgi:hypothetical protein
MSHLAHLRHSQPCDASTDAFIMARDERQRSTRDSSEAGTGPLCPTDLGTGLGTGFGDRFEEVEGRSGLSEGGRA